MDLSRRNFLAAVAAAAGTGNKPAAAAAPLLRARWIDNGIINAGGSHEPYSFIVRRGGQPLDARARYERAQSEEVIRRLRDNGVEVFHTHLYKGAGMAHEKSEMEDARRAAEIAHGLGMRVDSYIQWNTLMYETFFVEEPRAKDWIQRDSLGRPILLTYGYQQGFRYKPCFSSSEYINYLKKVVRFAIEEVKTDLLHFDNFDQNPEPESCRCHRCVRDFRDFLRSKYTPERRKERFGFDNVDYVNPPEWNTGNPPQKLEIIYDPVIQEWIDFRCQQMADWLKEIATFAKSLNPEVVVEVNPHGITGGNRAWETGLDHARFLKYTEVFWTEEENRPNYLPSGHLVSTIRSYKLARTFRNTLFTYTEDHPLSTAEGLAFNQTIGFAGEDPLVPHMLRYIDFYRKHRALYTGTEDAGNVAVLRSFPSITYHNSRAQLSAVLAEQTLIQTRIPFDLIFDEHLADLSKYRVLVLPDSLCLSGGQLAAVRKFVEQGGGLVATGQAGAYDEWRRLRPKPGLPGLETAQPAARPYQQDIRPEELRGREFRTTFGKGRVAYFPEIQYDGRLPVMRDYFRISSRFWKLPANWEQIANAVRWAAFEDIPVEIGGPVYLVAHVVRQAAQRRMMIHLLNYQARNGPAVDNVSVTFRLPDGRKPGGVELLSPDANGRTQAPVTPAGPDRWRFSVPTVRVYTMAVIRY